MIHWGRYLEVSSPERLVFTWGFPPRGADEQPMVTVVTVDFVEDRDGTILRIGHQKLSSGQAVDMDVGWNSTLDALTRYVEDSFHIRQT